VLHREWRASRLGSRRCKSSRGGWRLLRQRKASSEGVRIRRRSPYMVRSMNMPLPIGRYCLNLCSKSRPASLSRVLFLRKLSWGGATLIPYYGGSTHKGRRLRHPILRKLLSNEDMGSWSMCARTLNFLEREIHSHRPAAILEFGS